jgi:DNA oxidative demethylase
MSGMLFEPIPGDLPLAEGAVLLGGFALADAPRVIAALDQVVAAAPFRRMVTPGGHRMSVAMTNCGAAGWVTDRRGYRYEPADPESGVPWPPMPPAFAALATEVAARGGFSDFAPDVCLINCYEPGARMSLHQDRDERDFDAPIVSVSLGLPATFLFGGLARADKPRRILLTHGDVVVWGGPAARFPRHRAACGWRAPVARTPPHQSYLSSGDVAGRGLGQDGRV